MTSAMPAEKIMEQWRPGSYDFDSNGQPWTWVDEKHDIGQDELDELANQVQVNGFTEPVVLGDDGRVWEGHHRILVGWMLALDVPYEMGSSHPYPLADWAGVSMSVELHPSGLPVAVMTVREEIYRHLGKGRCYAWRQTGPVELGVLAYEVCGLHRNHRGFRHQAGWTGHGAQWDDDEGGREGLNEQGS